MNTQTHGKGNPLRSSLLNRNIINWLSLFLYISNHGVSNAVFISLYWLLLLLSTISCTFITDKKDILIKKKVLHLLNNGEGAVLQEIFQSQEKIVGEM